MSLKFCKTCGTLYDEAKVECPKCATKALEPDCDELTYDLSMDKAEADRLRKKSWIQLIIGVPGLIGVLYLAGYLIKLFVSKQ